jgi:hypothetical protein
MTQRPWNKRDSATEAILAKCKRNERTGCLIYEGRTDEDGYARIKFDGRDWRCHKFIWTEATGDHISQTLHKCDNRRCCELGHLYAGNNTQNIADKVARDRSGKKLNIAKVKEIKMLLSQGATHKYIASLYGVNQSNITRIATGERWSHVEGQPMASAAK